MKQLAQITGINQPGPLNLLTPDVFLGYYVARILTFAIALSGLFFFVRLISAGYTYLTNAGDQNKIQSASKELVNALIGLLVVISAYFIIQVIQTIFGIEIL